MVHNKAFTLIELLVVIGIVAVLATIVVLTINPAELLRQARDARRLSEVSTLNKAISLYELDIPGVTPGSPNTIYISLPDLALASPATSTCSTLGLPTPPTSWNYNCVSETDLQNNDSTGWLPVDFQAISTGAPFAALPIDPVNDAASGLYYAYVTGGSYIITALLQSEKHLKGSAATDGGIDPARIEIGSNLQLWTQASGLVGYWKFDEGIGTTANDSSGNSNTGILTNMESTDWVDGNRNKALIFDGVDEYVNVSESSLPIGSTITIEAWIIPEEITSKKGIVVKGQSGVLWEYGLIKFGDEIGYRMTSGDFITDANVLTQDEPHHVVVVGDEFAQTIDVYVNGVKYEHSSLIFGGGSWTNNFIASSTNPLQIGNASGRFTEYFDGTIDEVRIYSRVLSAAEIQATYNATK